MINGLNCIFYFLLESLPGEHNYISRIDASRTNEGTFPAQHAFPDLLSYLFVLAAFQKDLKLPQAEARMTAGCACSRTASAFDTYSEA